MAIYLGSTSIDALYLGESGYGLANVVRVYLDSTIVWPVADMVVSGITDSNATALMGDYTESGNVNGKAVYIGPSLSSPPSNLSGRTICVYGVASGVSGYNWLLGFESSSGAYDIDSGYYFYAAATSSLSPPSSGWSPKSLTGSVTVVVNN